MIARSVMFAGSTPLPLPLACAALCAVHLLKKDRTLRSRLDHNVQYLNAALRAAGFPVPMTPVPVVAITPANSAQARVIKRRLLARGIYPSFIKYPGGPPDGYLRIVISSEHTKSQLDDLLAALDSSGKP